MTSAIIAGAPASTLVAEQKTFVSNNRGLVCGLGVNDLSRPSHVNRRPIKSYKVWHNMLNRCYSPTYQARQPTYVGCSVVNEWLYFSNFDRWYTEHYFEGAQLDKDLLFPGNKMYGPDTCVFVSAELNHLFVDRAAVRGACPLGVHKHRKVFAAHIQILKISVHLGHYATPLEAHRAWQLAKIKRIENFHTDNPRIRAALDLRVKQLRDDHANNRITTKL